MLETGIKNTIKVIVDETNTASAWKSGTLDVFSTPAMIANMECCSAACVEPYLETGKTTVGTLVNVKHLRATPMGKTVTVDSCLTEIDRRRLVFSVTASDDKGVIGEGIHERFIIDTDKFMEKVNS